MASQSSTAAAATIAANPSPCFRRKPTRRCLCSPTNHPGSFRCHLHRNASSSAASSGGKRPAKAPASLIKSQWEKMSPAAKANSLKALFLLQIIKPSSHDLRRRRDFQPKPSRFFLHHHGDAVS